MRHSMIFSSLTVITLILLASCQISPARPAPSATSTLRPGVIPSRTPDYISTLAAGYEAVTATAFAEANPDIAAGSEWPVVFFDSFDTNANDWPTGDYDDDLVTGEQQISDGKYRWEATAGDSVVWRLWPSADPVSDFYLTVDIQQISGSGNGLYGVIFRQESGNYYLFQVREDLQQTGFFILLNGGWSTLMDYTSTPAVRNGQENRIVISATGSHFVFFVNDHFVGEVFDSQLPQGETGIAIELLAAHDEILLEFDNFELRAPEASDDSN